MPDTPVIEKVLNVPCPSCGGRFVYSAEKLRIHCEYCGYGEDINECNDKVEEAALQKAIEESEKIIPEHEGQKVMDCQNCGAKFMVGTTDVKADCAFCGSKNINLEAFEHNFIQPVGIVPFRIPQEDGQLLFEKWIKGGWFHPNKLKRLAKMEALHGIYLPFWTYDAQTESNWTGEAGHTTYTHQRAMVNGRWQTQRVPQIRWTRRSGHLSHFFDDILVVGSQHVQQQLMERIFPFKLDDVVNYDPRYMLGWEAEVYDLNVRQGYERANVIMDGKLRALCAAELGGDQQRFLAIQSQKFDQTFKHIMLPIWLCSYQYQNEIYQFAINGQTGRVNGKKPLSYIKIGFLIFLFVALLALLFFLKTQGYLEFETSVRFG